MRSILTSIAFLLCLSATAQSDTARSAVDYSDGSIKIPASFPGGLKGWTTYLSNNLKAELGAKYIRLKGASEARQTVVVSFLVDTDGRVSELKVMNPDEVHRKLAEEAVRVIQEGPKWIPASIDGKKVVFHQLQPITFVVTKG